MGKKRKQDQNEKTSMPRDEMPLEEGTSNTFPSSIRDVLMQFKDIIQVKVDTDECLKNLEQTVKKLVDKVKKLEGKMKRNKIKEVEKKEQIKELKEDLKTELILLFQEQMQTLEEKVENKSKEHFSVFIEDFKKPPEEVKEEPYLEMQKEGSAKLNHFSESSSLRSQPHQSHKTSFHLKFVSEIDAIVYKGKPMLTIEVVLYDGDNPIAPDHYLASAAAEVVVVDGEFAGELQGYSSKDEFVQSIMKSRQGNNSQGEPPKVRVKNGRFKLVGGRHRLEGVVIMENSNRKDVKLGVMIVGNTEERVLEGVSNSFRVQEAKTAEKRGKRITDEIPEDLPRFIGQNNSQVRNKKGNGSVGPLPSESSQYHAQEDTTQQESYGQGQQHIFPSPKQNVAPMPNQLKRKNAHTAGNGPVGQPLGAHLQQHNTNQQENHEVKGQQYSVPTPQPINFQNIPDPSGITYPYAAGKGPVPLETSQYPTQQDTTQPESYGQGAQHSFPPAKHNFTPTPNQLQRLNAHSAGNGAGCQPVVFHLQQQNTTHHEDQGQVKQNIPPKTGPIHSHNMPSRSGMTYHHTSGKVKKYIPPKVGPINFHNHPNPSGVIYHQTAGTLPLDPLQYRTQQDITGVGSYVVQGPQNTFLQMEPNFGIVPNQSQKIHAHTTGYGPGGQPLVYHTQQQNTSQQGVIQQKDNGQGQQYMQTRTRPISFHNMSNPSGIPYHHTTATLQGPQNTFLRAEHNLGVVPNQLRKMHAHTAGNGPGGQPLVDYLQQQNSTQQGSTQHEDHGSDLTLKKRVKGSSADDTSFRPFPGNAFEEDAAYLAVRCLQDDADSGCSPDHPVASEDAYQNGGANDLSAPAPESTDGIY